LFGVVALAWTAGTVEFVSGFVSSQQEQISSWFDWVPRWMVAWAPKWLTNYPAFILATVCGCIAALPAAFFSTAIVLFFWLREKAKRDLTNAPRFQDAMKQSLVRFPLGILCCFWIPFVIAVPVVLFAALVVPRIFNYGLLNGVEYWSFVGACVMGLSAALSLCFTNKDSSPIWHHF